MKMNYKTRSPGTISVCFSVVTVNDEDTKLRFKAGMCAELCLKLWLESDWYISK